VSVRRKRGRSKAGHGRPSPGRVLIAVMALLALPVAGCGGSGSGSSSSQAGASSNLSASSSVKYAGVAAAPSKPAPPLALRDSLGRQVNLDQYRGKAVLVTFIYDHCPDVCPIIVGNLHTAQAQLGTEANNLQIVAVSVDPKGDTPETVKAFLAEHRMTGRMEYLLGSQPQLERVWRAWSILSKATPKKGNPDLVEHSALVYGISGSGKLTTLYPQNFRPAQIVHDVPILVSE
jgi:protein SCO1/2